VLKLRCLFLHDVQTAQNFLSITKGSYRKVEDLLKSCRVIAMVSGMNLFGPQEI
jgi:hypothetical protein